MKTEEIGGYIIFQKFVGKWKSQNLKTHEVRGVIKSCAQYQWGEIKPPRSESLARKYQRFTRSVCDVTYGIACQLVLWFTGVATSFSASAVRGELGGFSFVDISTETVGNTAGRHSIRLRLRITRLDATFYLGVFHLIPIHRFTQSTQ